MTTIAWDGKTLAVDSKSCMGSIVESTSAKKLYLNVGEYKAVAVTGELLEALDVIDWLKGDKLGKFPKGEEGALVCVDKKGDLYTYHIHGTGRPEKRKGVFSEGSGWAVALGALDCGSTAVEAVKIAAKRCVYTGGKIQSYTHV